MVLNVKYFIVGAIIIALNNILAQTTYNTTGCLPIADDCSFYSRCLEAQVPCGRKGYAIGFGLYYCNEFKAHSKRFSSKGQKWLKSTMLCLQVKLIDVANGKVKMNCGEIRKFAFNSHASCYTQPGSSICTIPLADWLQLFIIIYKNLGDPETQKSMLKVAQSCGFLYFKNILDSIDTMLLN